MLLDGEVLTKGELYFAILASPLSSFRIRVMRDESGVVVVGRRIVIHRDGGWG